MGRMILKILGIIGKTLLVILIVLIVLILLLLFVPFGYKGQVKKDTEKTQVYARLSWLFVVLRAVVRYEAGGEAKAEVYLLGIPLTRVIGFFKRIRTSILEGKERRQRRKLEKELSRKMSEQERPAAEQAAPSGDTAVDEHLQSGTEETEDSSIETAAPQADGAQNEAFSGAKIRPSVPPGGHKQTSAEPEKKSLKFFSKIKEIYGKIKAVIELLRSDYFRGAFRAVRRYGFRILRHIRPRRINGSLIFGFEDPANTGQALAVIALVYGFGPRGLRVTPDFTDKRFEADLSFGGHFFLIYLIIQLVRLYRTEDLRKLLRRLRDGRKQSA